MNFVYYFEIAKDKFNKIIQIKFKIIMEFAEKKFFLKWEEIMFKLDEILFKFMFN